MQYLQLCVTKIVYYYFFQDIILSFNNSLYDINSINLPCGHCIAIFMAFISKFKLPTCFVQTEERDGQNIYFILRFKNVNSLLTKINPKQYLVLINL